MKVAGFYDESITNGPGWRAVLFVSGCHHNCPGCHNQEAQNFCYGEDYTEEKKNELLNRIKENSIIKGITISGGDPLCKENIPGVLDFVKSVKEIRPNLNVMCYTGYKMENLMETQDENLKDVLKEIDVIVDGPFIESKKIINGRFRGSDNQRFIDVPKCLSEQKIIEKII